MGRSPSNGAGRAVDRQFYGGAEADRMTTEQRTVDAAARVLYEELRGATSTKGLGSLLGAPPW